MHTYVCQRICTIIFVEILFITVSNWMKYAWYNKMCDMVMSKILHGWNFINIVLIKITRHRSIYTTRLYLYKVQ